MRNAAWVLGLSFAFLLGACAESEQGSGQTGSLLIHCAHDRHCPPYDGTGICEAGQCVDRAGQLLSEDRFDEHRASCLEPPWVLEPDNIDFVPVRCANPPDDGRAFQRSVAFRLFGTRSATREELEAISPDVVFDELGVLGFSPATECCEGDWPGEPGLCVAINLMTCRTPIARLVKALYVWKGQDPARNDMQLNVLVNLYGLLAPRCSSGECGSMPFNPANAEPAPTERRPIPGEVSSILACDHDGECVFDGCRCGHWTEMGGRHCPEDPPEQFTDRPELEAAYCGCATNRCTWFD